MRLLTSLLIWICAMWSVNTKRLYLTLCLCALLSACSSTNKAPVPQTNQQSSPQLHSPPSSPVVDKQSAIIAKLNAQHQEWRGTKHQLGGLSKYGVDCSGFVYLTFLQKFSINLPRTTQLQSKQGSYIPRQQLKAGDLVFFKTGIKVRHVGIYIDNNQFLHASTSKGVMISNLDNRYWNKAYWQARRISSL